MASNTEARRLNRVIQITLKTTGPDTKEVSTSINTLIKSAIAANIGAGALGSIIKGPEKALAQTTMDLATGEEIISGVNMGASLAFPPAALINLAFAGMILSTQLTGGKI